METLALWPTSRQRQNQTVVVTQVEIDSVKPLVVVVDDDLAIRGSLSFSLQTEGFAVRSYASGTELLRDISLGKTRCLVIDYQLTGMNGLDLLAELRRRHVTAPAILITTHPSALLRERAAATGVALVEKPLLGDALFLAIHAALRA